jgi:hypothetical protein
MGDKTAVEDEKIVELLFHSVDGSVLDDLFERGLIGPSINDDQSCIDVSREIGIDRIGQPPVLPDLLKKPRAHPSPENRVQDGKGVPPWVGDGKP